MSMRHGEGRGVEAVRQRRAWWLGGALVACVLLAALAVAMNDLRVRRDAGERYLQALTGSHARQIANQVDTVERAFHALADALAALQAVAPDAGDALAHAAIRDISGSNPYIRGLRVDAEAPGFLPVEAFRSHSMQLGPPERGADGRWTLPVAMLLRPGPPNTPWLRGELDVAVFGRVRRAHEVGPQGVASVLTADGVLISRSDSGARHAGADVRDSPVFRALADADAGMVLESRSPVDGVQRVVGFRRIEGRPLVATVGMTPRALYGGWHAFAATLATGMGLLVGAWVLGMWFLKRAARRESSMRQSMAASEHAIGHLRARVRDAEAQYRFLYEQHPLPAIVYDRETLGILEANDAAQHQFRRDRRSMLGLDVGELLAEGATEDIRQEMLAHPQAHGRRIWAMRRGDGTSFSGLVFARDLVAFDERPARLVLTLDVTDRIRAEADLRLLRRAVEASEEGVFVLDADHGSLVYGNLAFTRLTGVDLARDAATRVAAVDAIVDPDARRIVDEAMARAEDVRVEVSGRRDAGDRRCLELRLTPVIDAAGAASHFVGIVTDVTVRKRAAEEMAFRASHDALTGLVNRDCLIEAIDEAVAEAGAAVVCHLDLDRFQLVNDSLGHGVGDELLVSVARRLEAAAGAQARVARLGGDEFGILLPLGRGTTAAERVEALRAAVAGTVEVRGVTLHVTPSIGYSRHPADGADGTTLLRAASQAGVQAKRLGRNRSLGYRREFDSHAGDRLLLVQELHRALEREEFELAFQLQFDADGRPCGMEALARWRHPERGLVGPGVFMPACEESGLVLPLGRWVLREAVRCWRRLDDCGWGALRIGVNISALQFQEHLLDDVAQVMDEFRLPRGRLELELTESVLLDTPDEARRVMEALSALGASLAIDDFGTGYSSLAYLKHLPLQRLKLDQSFVRDLGRDPDSEAICVAILRMAQGLDLTVVAEGVETWHQHGWLRERGCEEFQGYLLARPAPFDDVLARLAAGRSVPGPATGLA